MKKTHMTEKRSNMLVPTVVAGAVVLVLGAMAQPVYAQEISGTVDGPVAVTSGEIADDTSISIDAVSASDLTVTDGADADNSTALTVTGGTGDDPALVVTGGTTTDTLNATGNSTVGGTLGVTGNTVIGRKAIAGATPDATATPAVEATLDVTGATNLHKDVVIGRKAVEAVPASGGSSGSGAIAEQSANLEVLGTTTTRGLTSSGDVTIGTAAVADNPATTADEAVAAVPANLTVNGASSVTGNSTVGGTLDVGGTSRFAQDVTIGTLASETAAAAPADLTVLGVTTIGAPVNGGIPGVEGGLMVYGGQTAASGYAVQIHANKALHARGDVTIGTAAVADNPATAVDETTAAVPANLTVNGDTTFNGDVAFKGGIDFGSNAVSVSNSSGNGVTTTTAGATTVTGGAGGSSAAKASLSLDGTSASVTNSTGHGVEISQDRTVISGGTTSTSVALNNDSVRFSDGNNGSGNPVKVTGIADGTSQYDAVNFGQLEDLKRDLSKGIAATTAAANIPQVAQGKTMSVGAGLGGYNGETAVAVGLHYRLAENAVVRATVATGGKKAAYGLGAALSW